MVEVDRAKVRLARSRVRGRRVRMRRRGAAIPARTSLSAPHLGADLSVRCARASGALIGAPNPTTPKSQKRRWEAIGRIFYGFLDPKLITKWAMPDANGSKFDGSKSCSFFHGVCADAMRAAKDGLLQAKAEA